MQMAQAAVTLSVSVSHWLEQAYLFLKEPENFPKWATGLASGVTREDGKWFGASPEGKVEVTFSEANPYGVLDHWVKLPSGQELYIPLRVIANGSGCEVMLTVFRRDGSSDEEFARDQDWVRRDLLALKDLLEAADNV
jgi:hypothetical protein